MKEQSPSVRALAGRTRFRRQGTLLRRHPAPGRTLGLQLGWFVQRVGMKRSLRGKELSKLGAFHMLPGLEAQIAG